MSDELTSVSLKMRLPAEWVTVLDAFAQALELPYASRASAVRFCIESALPMLQAMTEAAEAAKSSPTEFQERIAELSRLMDRDVAEFRTRVRKLRSADRPPLTGGSAHA